MSFGPFGRVMATILLCAVPLWWSLTYSFVMFVMWVFVVTPLLLRSIWKRAAVVGIDPRTTVEGPPKPGTGA